MRSISDEIMRLHRCVRNLVALSAPPRTWIDKILAEIAQRFADVLRSALHMDFVYIRLQGFADGVTREAVCNGQPSAIPARVEEIGRALSPWLQP